MKNDLRRGAIKMLVKLDSTVYPNFNGFGPDFPKVGDMVNPRTFSAYDFTYKLTEIPTRSKLTMEEVKSTNWRCSGLRENSVFEATLYFSSVNKIDGRYRYLTFRDWGSRKVEVAEIPDKEQLIVDYMSGKYTLIELLKIFRIKGYATILTLKSLNIPLDGNEYLRALEDIENEKDVQDNK